VPPRNGIGNFFSHEAANARASEQAELRAQSCQRGALGIQLADCLVGSGKLRCELLLASVEPKL
jgi:hypothetical protein